MIANIPFYKIHKAAKKSFNSKRKISNSRQSLTKTNSATGIAGVAGVIVDMVQEHEPLYDDDDAPFKPELKHWKPATTNKEKYEICLLRFETNWHDEIASFNTKDHLES